MDKKLLGKRLKYARNDLRNMTLQDVADAVGVARSTVQRYETGKIENIKLPVVESFARALQVNPSWLIGQSDTMILETPAVHFSSLTTHEQVLLHAYRSQKDMQPAIDRLLGIEKNP